MEHAPRTPEKPQGNPNLIIDLAAASNDTIAEVMSATGAAIEAERDINVQATSITEGDRMAFALIDGLQRLPKRNLERAKELFPYLVGHPDRWVRSFASRGLDRLALNARGDADYRQEVVGMMLTLLDDENPLVHRPAQAYARLLASYPVIAGSDARRLNKQLSPDDRLPEHEWTHREAKGRQWDNDGPL